MNLIFKTSFLIMSTAFMISCSGSDAPTFDPSTGSGSGSGSSSNTVDSPLHAEVKINWIGSTQKTSIGTCTVPRSAPAGTFINCNMQVPELTMFYSDFEFTVSTNSRNTCKQVVFMPYMFQRSTSATFLDRSNTEVDCALAEDPTCYGGAAKHIITKAGLQFPQATGIYFLTSSGLQMTYKMDAIDTNRKGDNYKGALSNIVVANNLSLGARSTALPASHPYTAYVAGTFRDYIYECSNDWGEILYRITLVIGDDDIIDVPTQAPVDTIWDWTGL